MKDTYAGPKLRNEEPEGERDPCSDPLQGMLTLRLHSDRSLDFGGAMEVHVSCALSRAAKRRKDARMHVAANTNASRHDTSGVLPPKGMRHVR